MISADLVPWEAKASADPSADHGRKSVESFLNAAACIAGFDGFKIRLSSPLAFLDLTRRQAEVSGFGIGLFALGPVELRGHCVSFAVRVDPFMQLNQEIQPG